MDFAQMIAEERKKLGERRMKLTEDKRRIDTELAEVAREEKAISAYEQAKAGKSATTTRRAPTGRRSGVREAVLEVVKQHPDGIKKADILAAMNADDDKAKMSISNALANLKKSNVLTSDGGNYKAA